MTNILLQIHAVAAVSEDLFFIVVVVVVFFFKKNVQLQTITSIKTTSSRQHGIHYVLLKLDKVTNILQVALNCTTYGKGHNLHILTLQLGQVCFRYDVATNFGNRSMQLAKIFFRKNIA